MMANKQNEPINIIDLKIADASDDELKSILEVRKKYDKDERATLIKGLIFIAEIDGEYSQRSKIEDC